MRPDVPFEPVSAARRILRQARVGALATLAGSGAGSGGPFASLITVATLSDGTPVMLLSDLAVHTRNLTADARASILLEERTPGDPMAGGRVSLVGTARRLARADDAQARSRFLARQPEAEGYAGFADFAFWVLDVDRAHLVAGFGRIVEVAGRDLLLDPAAAPDVVHSEISAVEHMNADHADALALYARVLLGAPDGAWRAIGLDPDGIDLMLDLPEGPQVRRLAFPRLVQDAYALRAVLKDLAVEARSQLQS